MEALHNQYGNPIIDVGIRERLEDRICCCSYHLQNH